MSKNPRNKETFFRKNCFIKVGSKTIYFNEIVRPNDFKNLYLSEKISLTLRKEVNTKTPKPFFNIPAAICKKFGLQKSNLFVIRISNSDKTYELFSKIYIWGKIHIPRHVINSLNIQHHQKVKIEVVKEANFSQEDKINFTKLFERDNKVKIFKRANGFVTIYSNGRLPITLPNTITLSPKLIESFFLIHGDGHYKSKLFFTNNDPNLHKFIIDVFENELKIPHSIWRARINLRESLPGQPALQYWMENVKLSTEQFYPLISRTKFNTSTQGNLRIVIDNTIVSQIFRKIFSFMKENLDRELSLHALNGLLAAEGGAQIDKIGLHRITLSYNQDEKPLFKVVLRNCGVLHLFKEKDKENQGVFILEKWENFFPFFSAFLSKNVIPFQLHKNRKDRAFIGLNNHSFTQTMQKYLSVLKKKENFTVKELSRTLKIRNDSCLSTIRKQQYSKFINIKGKGINRNPYIISISPEGDYLLNLILNVGGILKREQTNIC